MIVYHEIIFIVDANDCNCFVYFQLQIWNSKKVMPKKKRKMMKLQPKDSKQRFYLFCHIRTLNYDESISPILIWVYPRKFSPRVFSPHSLQSPQLPPPPLHSLDSWHPFLQTITLALLLHLCPPCLLWNINVIITLDHVSNFLCLFKNTH